MKFYCIGSSIPLIKLAPSNNFIDNLPFFGTPLLGLLPVTKQRMHDAYAASEQLILCKNLEDAKTLRNAKIRVGNTNVTPELSKGAIAQGYPLGDYVIYQIEIKDDLMDEIQFTKLVESSNEQLKQLVHFDLYFQAFVANDRTQLPDIELCQISKESINPDLLECHYFRLENGEELIDICSTSTSLFN